MRLAWALAAGSLGLVSAALFTSWLRLPRPMFVIAHAIATAGLTAAYVRATRTPPAALLVRWPAGLLAGLMAGAVLLRGVLAQPASAGTSVTGLAIVWLGIVYGAVDALLLNILPVHPLLSTADASPGWARRAAALGVSLVVTAAYHLGFDEFRGPELVQPLVGNAVITGSYLVSRSPLAAVLSHVIMHVAAVMHGIETTVQLPPHY